MKSGSLDRAVLRLLLLLATIPVAWAQRGRAQMQTARYEIVFDATWSPQTHPSAFPPNPHFSPLVGATHDDRIVFWEPEGFASDGIESMAETGGTSVFASEVDDAIAAGWADQLLLGSGLVSPGTTSLTLTVDRDRPRLTLVSMLAPSPDWFVGVHGVSLVEGGWWIPEVVVELHAYDAGTDLGATYLAPDADAVPASPIALQGVPLELGVPVGAFTIRRLPEPELGLASTVGWLGLARLARRRSTKGPARRIVV
ncbi:MAG: spondin domain-containing protein [Myxococcota bacterium]